MRTVRSVEADGVQGVERRFLAEAAQGIGGHPAHRRRALLEQDAPEGLDRPLAAQRCRAT